MKINTLLTLLAIAGGFSAAFTDHSTRNSFYPVRRNETKRIDGQKVHFISAPQLADMLYHKEKGITLMDARDEDLYKTYHIPAAIRYKVGDAIPDQYLSGKVVIYWMDNDDQLVQFYDEFPGEVTVLKGGIAAWYSLVLFPDFMEYKVRNQDKLEHIISRSRYFGGSPRNAQILNIAVRESRYREGC